MLKDSIPAMVTKMSSKAEASMFMPIEVPNAIWVFLIGEDRLGHGVLYVHIRAATTHVAAKEGIR